MQKQLKGFTLIELLVVIAIIGVLSSVVLASLNSARTKSRIAAVREEVRQFSNIMALQYAENGSYAAFNTDTWLDVPGECNSFFGSSAYANSARGVCEAIIAQGSRMWVRSTATTFIIYVRRPDGTEQYFCRNHHGLQAENGISSGPTWTPAACTDSAS